MNKCNSCAWFLHRDFCRDELNTALKNADHDGYCVERSNNCFFMPMIHRAINSQCGKWEAVFDE